MKQNTIQITIFDAFLNTEDFSLKEATSVVKEKKQLKVNGASIRARIYKGIEKGIFKKYQEVIIKYNLNYQIAYSYKVMNMIYL